MLYLKECRSRDILGINLFNAVFNLEQTNIFATATVWTLLETAMVCTTKNITEQRLTTNMTTITIASGYAIHRVLYVFYNHYCCLVLLLSLSSFLFVSFFIFRTIIEGIETLAVAGVLKLKTQE